MSLYRRTVKLLALAGIALATTAWAQNEQWLEYHTSREGRGYRYLDLTTNPPANVALPKFNAQPYFARWTTPMDPNGGRWLCFDRSRKTGPYDLIYLDSNGNGRLDDKPVTKATRVEEYYTTFDPLRMTFKGEDGPITYHIIFRFSKYPESDANLLAESGCWYEGKVNIDGKKRKIELIDGNVNGTFNDRGANPRDSDRVSVEGNRGGERYLGKLLEIDSNQLYQVEVARDGAFIKLQKAENIVWGTVHVPETITEFTVTGENGHFIRQPASGEFKLPLGKYRIEGWNIDRKDDKGVKWQLSGYGFSEKANFEVTADKSATLAVGEPIHAVFSAMDQSNSMVSFSLQPLGQFDESIQFLRNNERPKGPRLVLTSADGSVASTNSFEFG